MLLPWLIMQVVFAGDESWLKEADLDFFARGPAESSDTASNSDGSGAVVTV